MQHLQDEMGTPRTVLRVETPAAYEAWARRIRLGMHLPAALRRSDVAVAAHVSDGRWCIDCPCGSAALAEPNWGIGICADCGTIHPVTFPPDREDVEDVLLARPSPLQRHFFPGQETAERRGLAAPETLSALEGENRMRRLPVRRRGAD